MPEHEIERVYADEYTCHSCKQVKPYVTDAGSLNLPLLVWGRVDGKLQPVILCPECPIPEV